MDLEQSLILSRDPTTTASGDETTYELEVLTESPGLKRITEAYKSGTELDIYGRTVRVIDIVPDEAITEVTLATSY